MLQGHQPKARQAGLTALLLPWPFRTAPCPRWRERGVYWSFDYCKWKQPLFLSFLEEKPEEKIRGQRGHVWGCQQNWQGHTYKQRPLPRAELSLKHVNSNPSFWKLLGNPGSLSFRTVEPTLCSQHRFLPFSQTPLWHDAGTSTGSPRLIREDPKCSSFPKSCQGSTGPLWIVLLNPNPDLWTKFVITTYRTHLGFEGLKRYHIKNAA